MAVTISVKSAKRVWPGSQDCPALYQSLAKQADLSSEYAHLPEKEKLLKQVTSLSTTDRMQPARVAWSCLYKDEIIQFIKDKHDPQIPKTAYDVICERQTITASYTSFKRFMHEYVRGYLSKNYRRPVDFDSTK